VAALEEQRLVVLEDRVDADLDAGRGADLVAELDALVATHPLRERLHAQRMVALYRAGRQAEALQAYQASWKAMDAKVEYRRFVEGKLTSLGEPPMPSVVQGGGKALPPGIAPTR
jgi:DNA-binding SARP family transcriptional activator